MVNQLATTEEFEQLISASRLRLRMQSPFFATLSMFAHYKVTNKIATAATDGKTIYYNRAFLNTLTPAQQDGLLLHELLHAALLHGTRRGTREPMLWNIAADIIVNGLIIEDGKFELPPGGLRHVEWEKLSVEEVYELLLTNATMFTLAECDLLDDCDGDGDGDGKNSKQGSLLEADEAALRAHWSNAMQQAAVISRTQNQGKLPAGMERQFQELSESQIDWRTYLWRYLVQTPNDFQGFDRRFISRGLYIDAIAGESVQVFVAIDTSGSISDEQMTMFISEIKGILGSYPHLDCQLYYADAEAYGPYSLKPNSAIPKPEGGGGTSFIPFFENVEATREIHLEGVCVYLTDGYGDFPSKAPSLPVLWVVTPGGLNLQDFPFGEAVRLLGKA